MADRIYTNVPHVELLEHVSVTLDQAVANGYPDLVRWLPEEVAADLHEYDQTYEEVDPKLLLPYIMKWQAERRPEYLTACFDERVNRMIAMFPSSSEASTFLFWVWNGPQGDQSGNLPIVHPAKDQVPYFRSALQALNFYGIEHNLKE